MNWLEKNTGEFLKELIAVGFDQSAVASMRFEALRWLLSRTLSKE